MSTYMLHNAKHSKELQPLSVGMENNVIPQLTGHVITYPCRDFKLTMLVKRAPYDKLLATMVVKS